MILAPLFLSFLLTAAQPAPITMPVPPTPIPEIVKVGLCGDIYIKVGQPFYVKVYFDPKSPNLRYEFIGRISKDGGFEAPDIVVLADLELREVAVYRRYPATPENPGGRVEVWVGPTAVQEAAAWFCGGYKDKGKKV